MMILLMPNGFLRNETSEIIKKKMTKNLGMAGIIVLHELYTAGTLSQCTWQWGTLFSLLNSLHISQLFSAKSLALQALINYSHFAYCDDSESCKFSAGMKPLLYCSVILEIFIFPRKPDLPPWEGPNKP